MDLKQYFKKIREIELSIEDQYPVIVSLATPDGGKAGRMSEVSRRIAAEMVVDGRAVLASQQEKEEYYEQQLAARKAIEREELSKQLQVAILSDSEFRERTLPKKTGK